MTGNYDVIFFSEWFMVRMSLKSDVGDAHEPKIQRYAWALISR